MKHKAVSLLELFPEMYPEIFPDKTVPECWPVKHEAGGAQLV